MDSDPLIKNIAKNLLFFSKKNDTKTCDNCCLTQIHIQKLTNEILDLNKEIDIILNTCLILLYDNLTFKINNNK